MLTATDSFLQYLSTRLAGVPPVAWVRASSEDAATAELQMDTLNVSILGVYQMGRLEQALVSLDLVGSDERTVLQLTQTIRDVLLEQQYIPEVDYSPDPDNPTAVGHFVYWNGAEIAFRIIASSQRAVHVNATFELSHVRQ